MAGFEIDIFGADRAAHELREIGERARDPRAAFHRIADLFRRREKALFVSGGGGLWRALAPQTVERKARAGQPNRPLIATGRLMRSLTVQAAPGAVEDVSRQQLRFGTALWYSRFQGKLGRPPVAVGGEAMETKVADVLADWLMGRL